jgi:hypothetical protein
MSQNILLLTKKNSTHKVADIEIYMLDIWDILPRLPKGKYD